MTYRVQLSPHAVREYQKLDASIKPDIAAALDALQHQPLAGAKIKRLKGRLRTYYRYRTGDYRIAYVVDTKARLVSVDYIQHRGDIYRHME
ncbi:MAG: type II toxin-antitoxin system RelE/ParE family toxin [Candidatus Omnitrophica bacterium]|nr:type II toxin-antitoxin system RelE/ParE family toxin [Candidatus Omnitrophota bacterium]